MTSLKRFAFAVDRLRKRVADIPRGATYSTKVIENPDVYLEDLVTVLDHISDLERENALIKSAVVQVNHGDSYFSLHKSIWQIKGHIGHNGPIIQIGEQIDSDDVAFGPNHDC